LNLPRKLMLLIAIALFAAAPLVVTGCNTIEGAGEDLQEASNEVEQEIEE